MNDQLLQMLQKKVGVKRVVLDEFGRIKEIEFFERGPLTAGDIKDFVWAYNAYSPIPSIPEKPTKILDDEYGEGTSVQFRP